MTTILRRAIQAGVLALIVLVWLGNLSGSWLLSWPVSIYVLDDIVPASVCAVAGLIAWSLRPRNRVGLLMMAFGVDLLLGPFGYGVQFRESFPLFGVLLGTIWLVWPVLLLHLLLAFPGGRLESRSSRALVRSLYVLVPLLGLLNGAFLRLRPSVFTEGLDVITGVAYAASLILGFVLILRRWILGGRARRRSLGPVFWSLAPIAIGFFGGTVLFLFGRIAGVPSLGSGTSFLARLEAASPLLLIALPIGFLIGLLRSGLDMTSVASLVVRLSDGLLPEQLQHALAQALHDPSLEVAYWVPALHSFADLAGRRVELPADGSQRAASVLNDATRPVAALIYDSSLRHEPQLVETAAAGVRMALENARLQVQLRAQLDEVEQSRARLVEAAQQERQRVERDLHDGAQQQLVTLLLSLQDTKAEAVTHTDPETAALLDANIAALKQALADLRELARGIYPSILREAGLEPALRSLAERSPIPVEVRGDLGDGRLAPPLEATLYFVAAEAITNAVKHSRARRISVSLQRGPDIVTLEISDDGQGGADLAAGSGLPGMSDRVAAMGGRLQVESNKGSGTRIRTEIPCV